MNILAVFFDFDGVIVDSEPLHWRAFSRVLEPEGLAFGWDEYRRVYIDFDDRDVFRNLLASAGRPREVRDIECWIQRKAEAFQALAAAEPPPLYPGVLELLAGLRGRARIGLCTGALQDDVRPILESRNLSAYFEVRVTADDVPASKPDPACYRLALERAGARGGVAIEDTPAGIQAARAAGLRVLAVATTHDRAELQPAERIVSRLDEVSADEVLDMAAS